VCLAGWVSPRQGMAVGGVGSVGVGVGDLAGNMAGKDYTSVGTSASVGTSGSVDTPGSVGVSGSVDRSDGSVQ
jgi:hypothetical protein